jgi:plasmid stabilization system protein ParE
VIFYQIREGRVEIIAVVHEKKDILSHSFLDE